MGQKQKLKTKSGVTKGLVLCRSGSTDVSPIKTVIALLQNRDALYTYNTLLHFRPFK